MTFKNRKWLLILALVCSVYALLRFWKLTDSCLWFDEMFSVHAAEHPWSTLLSFVAQDLIHPPLFYVALKIWISVGGESLFWLRLFPVVFSLIALAPFILLCRELEFSGAAVSIALGFFAFNGALIKYAQEVRMYSPLLCLSLFSLWLFARFLNHRKGLLVLLLVNVLLVYTHYYGWLVVISEVLAVVLWARESLKKILFALGATFLSFIPWGYAVWQATKVNADFGQNLGWMGKPNPPIVLQFIFDLLEPVYFQQSSIEPPTMYQITVPLLVIISAAFAFRFSSRENPGGKERQDFNLLLVFAFAPVLSALVASWILPHSIWGTRHLIISFAPFAMLLGFVLTKIQIRELKVVVLCLIFLFFLIAFWLQLKNETPRYVWCGWENLAGKLPQTKSNEPLKIYVFEDLIAYHFWFAVRNSTSEFQIDKVRNVAGAREDKAYFLPRGFDEVRAIDENGITGEKFWIAFTGKNWSLSTPPLRNFIEKGYTVGEPKVFDALENKAFLVEIQKPEK